MNAGVHDDLRAGGCLPGEWVGAHGGEPGPEGSCVHASPGLWGVQVGEYDESGLRGGRCMPVLAWVVAGADGGSPSQPLPDSLSLSCPLPVHILNRRMTLPFLSSSSSLSSSVDSRSMLLSCERRMTGGRPCGVAGVTAWGRLAAAWGCCSICDTQAHHQCGEGLRGSVPLLWGKAASQGSIMHALASAGT